MEEEKKVLDLNAITNECKILEGLESDIVVQNIKKLDDNFSTEELLEIYNHLLSVSQNQDVLMYLIRCVDKYRDKSSISIIVDLLMDRNNSDNLRSMCAKAIANFKSMESVTPLLYCLNNKDENYKVRLACADALGRIGDKYVVAPLINIVQDEEEKSVYVRESAAIALGMLGDMRAIDPLVSILESKKGFLDKFTFLKERIIEVLGKFHFSSERVLNALEHSLMDESPQIRINTIEALMEINDKKAYELIKTMLNDLDEEVKKNALIALYNMVGRDILDEILTDSNYDTFVKKEAECLIDEYENEDEENDEYED